MIPLKLRKVGNAVGTTFPQEVLKTLKVAEGDTVFLIEAPGGYRITAHDPGEQQMERASRIMKKRRNALRTLAK